MRLFTKLQVCRWSGDFDSNTGWAQNRDLTPITQCNLQLNGVPLSYPPSSVYVEYWAAIYHNEVVLVKIPQSFDPSDVASSVTERWPTTAAANTQDYSTELTTIFKAIFTRIVNESPASNYCLAYMGHGAGAGGLFELQIGSADARALLEYAVEAMGKKLAFFDAGGNCQEATVMTMQDVGPYTDYVVASEFPMGGRTKVGHFGYVPTIGADHYYGDAVFMTPYILAQTGKTNLELIKEIADTEKSIWEQDNASMQHYHILQSLSVFDSSAFSTFLDDLTTAVQSVPTLDYEAAKDSYVNELYDGNYTFYDLFRFVQGLNSPTLLQGFSNARAYYIQSQPFVKFHGMRFSPYTIERLAGVPTSKTQWSLTWTAEFADAALPAGKKRQIELVVDLVATPTGPVIQEGQLVFGDIHQDVVTRTELHWSPPREGSLPGGSFLVPVPDTGTKFASGTFNYNIERGDLRFQLNCALPITVNATSSLNWGGVTLTCDWQQMGLDIRRSTEWSQWYLRSRKHVGS